MPHLFAGIAIAMTDRLLLAYLTSYKHVGIYTAGAQVGMVSAMLAATMNQAWTPWAFEKLKIDSSISKREVVRATYWISAALLVFALCYAPIAYGMFRWLLDIQYFEGWETAVILTFSGVFTGLYYLVGAHITYHRKTAVHSLITFAIAFINIALSYFFIIWFGLIGAAIGTLIANMVAFVATFIYATRLSALPWRTKGVQ